MPYEFLQGVAMADIAFHAWGKTLNGLFEAASEAMLNIMVDNPKAVEPEVNREIFLQAETEQMLLFSLLEELIYYKDAQRLLLRINHGSLEDSNGLLAYTVLASGEQINPEKHKLALDVKAVTMHLFNLYRKEDAWHCTVVLDV